MREASKEYIIKTVFRTNTLPVISECNTSCIFCSHKQNPRNVETFRMPKMSLEDFKEVIEFLSSDRKIIIGESATRIVEGEPFLYRDILPLMSMIRKKFRKTAIQITTNGTLLEESAIHFLKDLGNVELNISLNCVEADKRTMVLGKNACRNIAEKIKLLKNNIIFSGSCVVVPGVVEREEVEEVVRLLDENGAQSVRVFLPGYSKLSGVRQNFESIHAETVSYVNAFRNKYSLPLIVEPGLITDLECRIEGIIKDSPAYLAGLKHGDIILEVNGQKFVTRVAAFDRIFRLKDPVLTILREENLLKFKVVKPVNTSAGLVVLFDIVPETASLVEKAVCRNKAESVLIITSELAGALVEKYLENYEFQFTYDIIRAKNEFFGGTIMCAGLLTVCDIIVCVRGYLDKHTKPDMILLPAVMFDYDRKDLVGTSIKEIERQFCIPVDTI